MDCTFKESGINAFPINDLVIYGSLWAKMKNCTSKRCILMNWKMLLVEV